MTEFTTILPNAIAAIAALATWGTGLGMRFLSKWDLTPAGKGFLGVTFAFALLLTMNTIHLYLKDYPGIWLVRTVVYTFLAITTIRIGWVVWKGIIWNKPVGKGYRIIFDDTREDVHVD